MTAIIRIQMWLRSLLESLNGGTTRRDAEWKHMIRVEAGRKSWETRRAREAKARADKALELHDDEMDAADVG